MTFLPESRSGQGDTRNAGAGTGSAAETGSGCGAIRNGIASGSGPPQSETTRQAAQTQTCARLMAAGLTQCSYGARLPAAAGRH